MRTRQLVLAAVLLVACFAVAYAQLCTDQQCCQNCHLHNEVCCVDERGRFWCMPGGCNANTKLALFPSPDPNFPAAASEPVKPVSAQGQWVASSYTQSIMMGIRMFANGVGFIAGGDNGIGASVIKTMDFAKSWSNPLTIHQPALMFSSVAAGGAGDAGADQSVVANGIGLVGLGGTQYTLNGADFTNSSELNEAGFAVNYQQSQDSAFIPAAPGGAPDAPASFGVPGVFGFWNDSHGFNTHYNMLGVSRDGGKSFQFTDLRTSSDPHIHARYASFPSSQVGFVVSGKWLTAHTSWPHRRLQHSAFLRVHAEHAGAEAVRGLKYSTGAQLRRQRKHASPQQQATGDVGIIQRSVDGFQTWQTVYTNYTYYFNQISCASEQVCFAVAENESQGFILRSTDGGDSWDTLATEEDTSLMACHALSEQEVWVGGGVLAQQGINGTAFHSVDGGASFTRTVLPGFYILDFDFVTPQQGFAVAMNQQGACNVLIYTEDADADAVAVAQE